MHGVLGFTKLIGMLIGRDCSELHSIPGIVLFALSRILILKFSETEGIGSIAGSHLKQDQDIIFSGSQTGTPNYDWDAWEEVILLNLLNNSFIRRMLTHTFH